MSIDLMETQHFWPSRDLVSAMDPCADYESGRSRLVFSVWNSIAVLGREARNQEGGYLSLGL